MLNAEGLNGIGQDADDAVVLQIELIRNVAGHENLPRHALREHTLWNTRVGASEPEDLGTLTLTVFRKQRTVEVVDVA